MAQRRRASLNLVVRFMRSAFSSCTIALLLAVLTACASSGSNTVAYRGETIHLSRAYSDYDEYKNGRNNIAAEDRLKVAKLVREAPIAASFPTREAAIRATFDVKFPGYGLASQQPTPGVAVIAVEVPTTSENRVIAVAQVGDVWKVVDDFLWADPNGYTLKAKLDGSRLTYLDASGSVIREHSLHEPN